MIRLPTRLKLFFEALARKYILRPEVAQLEGWIVSPGGVGTTFLLEYISGFIKVNDPYDKDGLKHWPQPPKRAGRAASPRTIFITGNPDEITASIVRRGWLQVQAAKIGSIRGALFTGELQVMAFKNSIRSQIARWKNVRSETILVIDYDDIWEQTELIARHLNLNEADFLRSFPPRKERQGSKAADSSKIHDKLP
jgi:hypothetical protein